MDFPLKKQQCFSYIRYLSTSSTNKCARNDPSSSFTVPGPPYVLHQTRTKAFLSATQPYSAARTLANDPSAHPRPHKPAALSLLLSLLFLPIHLVPIRSWSQAAASLPSRLSLYLWYCLLVYVKACVYVSLLSLFSGNFSRAGLLPSVPTVLGAW